MRKYAFVGEGYDKEENLDVLLFVPINAPTWSSDEEGAGYVCINRETGEFFNFLPYGTTELPTFTIDDVIAMQSAQADIPVMFPDVQ